MYAGRDPRRDQRTFGNDRRARLPSFRPGAAGCRACRPRRRRPRRARRRSPPCADGGAARTRRRGAGPPRHSSMNLRMSSGEPTPSRPSESSGSPITTSISCSSMNARSARRGPRRRARTTPSRTCGRTARRRCRAPTARAWLELRRNGSRGPSFSMSSTRNGRGTAKPSQSTPEARCSASSTISVVLPLPPLPTGASTPRPAGAPRRRRRSARRRRRSAPRRTRPAAARTDATPGSSHSG